MAENKTKATKVSVAGYINAISDETKRADAKTLVKVMQAASGEKAKMWGPSIVGFGTHHYKYESGREGDTPIVAFSPRSSAIVLYGMRHAPNAEALIAKLGKIKTGKGCLYVKRLADVDMTTLEKLVRGAIKASR
jgi:Domain of unknown function (DU1801)